MKCPCCGKEMIHGVIQSGRQVFFTTEPHKHCFIPEGNEEVLLTTHNWTRPTCVAFHCSQCKKVIIDYSDNVG